MEARSIAVDGPSGAGKSTLSRMAAKRFGRIYVDTGALYRCVGLFALRSGLDSKDEKGVTLLLTDIKTELSYDVEGIQHMFLNGEDVSSEIRLPQVSIYASNVSAMPSVRAHLLTMQREMAEKYDVIMDGRDIGTVVLPHAGLKIYLTAALPVRARRRYDELLEKNVDTTYDVVLDEMRYRDTNDSERVSAPLKVADGAVVIDTTDMDMDQSFAALCSVISERFSI